MKPFEIILSVKLRVEGADAARAVAEKIASAMRDKVGPSSVQVVQAIREEECFIPKRDP